MSRDSKLTKRAFLRKATATAGVAAGVGLASEPVAAGCTYDTLTTDEGSDVACFTREKSGFYTHAEARLYIESEPNTEWDFKVNNSSSSDGLCESPWDQQETVTSDSETIGISRPDDFYGVQVDKNGDDLNYDLELWYCA
jgi:hypothetical protein